jgi:hypothetical protein
MTDEEMINWLREQIDYLHSKISESTLDVIRNFRQRRLNNYQDKLANLLKKREEKR